MELASSDQQNLHSVTRVEAGPQLFEPFGYRFPMQIHCLWLLEPRVESSLNTECLRRRKSEISNVPLAHIRTQAEPQIPKLFEMQSD
jgi:hypothetical protein